MSKREIKAGATSQTIDVFIQDSSVSTGAGLTGLVYNTASLTAYYRKGATGTPTAITLATQTVGGAYSSGGFVAVDGTNCPGQYRLDLPNAAVDTAGMVTIYLRGATNMAPCVMEIEVVAVDKFDAVRYGMTALPNAAAESSGGLYTRGSGAGQINQTSNGLIDVNAARTGNTVNTGRDIGASVIVGDFLAGSITSAAFADGAIASGKIGTGAIGAVVFGTGAISADALATDAVEEIRDSVITGMAAAPVGSVTGAVGSVSDPSGIATAVWNALTSALTTTGSVGKRLVEFVTTLVYSTPPTASANADAVVAKTLTQPTSGAPPASPTVAQALMYPYVALVNDKADGNATDTVAPSQRILYDTAGDPIAKATISTRTNGVSQGKLGAP